MSRFIRTEMDSGVLELSIDRPESKSAITNEMDLEFAQKLRDADASPGVKAILLTGGGGAFIAGNDIPDFIASPPDTDGAPVYSRR